MSSELKKLEQVNQELARVREISHRELLDMNVIEESQELVHRVGATSEAKQRLPFTKLYLPMAFTGILEPNKSVDQTHRAILILLPGTGTTFSVAETLCDIAGTFHGRKSKNRGRGRKSNQSLLTELLPDGETFRVASFPTDLPLNGMGSNAPFEFASEQGLITVIRHVHLVLSRLYPDRPVFIAGRSQGGIAAILYAQHYDDLAGAIAVNPPHPDPELFQFTVQYLEDKAKVLADLLHAPGVTLHERSWEAYKTFTPDFDYPSRPSLSPILTLVSLGDPFNLFPQYAHALKAFAENDEKNQLHILDAGHNLWDRKSVETYREVINLQAQFMLSQIKYSDNNYD
ncbi:MAG: alpha/beta hydrolase [Moorea sp. SIO3I7]|uniref:alpha/beta hydrolase n=1 Tax=unclassified Moorena TaxID=2683338 RepID=UPI0013C0F6CE|nr:MULTISPECIES: alpha/beta fold hydrolase [unclassified Moorena]NEN95015.1 alpha/beta hydrolase [Moorena sp. SIO3I7]NEO09729.1 alpha/beta hydrolase [Moorena sp. SIO3I8]NEP22175.1 alpha/beta hydrolase [Moorena sp. SIO3I6]NEQ60909.1 alpha/beta hydrolase [Moorena sp. SIO4A1]